MASHLLIFYLKTVKTLAKLFVVCQLSTTCCLDANGNLLLACLHRLVKQMGVGNWSQIAIQFPGRISKQCRYAHGLNDKSSKAAEKACCVN